METDHLTPQRTADFLARRLSGAELLAVDDHLAACAECRGRLRAEWPVAEAVAAWQEVTAPPPRWRNASVAASLLGLAAALLVVLLGTPEATLETAATPRSSVTPTPRPEETAAPEPAVATLRDGPWTLELSQSGKVSGLDRLPLPWRERMAAALAGGRVKLAPLAAELAGAAAALRGTGQEDELALLAPLATAVPEAAPLFEWRGIPNAEHYRVRVSTADYLQVAESPPLTATRWQPPTPLPRGETLSWQVTATVGDEELSAPRPPAPEARFVVLAPAQAEALAADLRVVGASRLGRALAFADAGCRRDAARELAALAADNPGSELAQGLLESVAGRSGAGAPRTTNGAQ